MAMTNKVNVADGGGSGKKKEYTKPEGVQPTQTYNSQGYPVTVNAESTATNRPEGRQTNVQGEGTGLYRRGEGLGTGPVGRDASEVAAVGTAISQANKQPASSGSGGGGGGGGGGSSSSSQKAELYDAVDYVSTLPEFQAPEVDPALKQKYETAMATLEGMKGKAPVYTSQYDEQLKILYEQITGRQPFKYDSSTDPLYQQYRQSYIAEGGRAMRDTMGQAAALTGGYGSSYAQSVGQQAYDRYLERLADILPETYGLALDAYNAEGDRLDKELATTQELEKSDYDRYLDSLNKYYKDLSVAQDEADTAYSRMIYGDETAYSRAVDDYNRRLTADDLDYERKQNYYNRLVSLIGIGYKPTAEDYANAGLTPTQGAAIRQQYLDSIAPVSSGGGGGYTTRKTTASPSTTTSSTTPNTSVTKYSLADVASDLAGAKHSNQAQDIARAYDQAVKNGQTTFTQAEWNKYKQEHRI